MPHAAPKRPRRAGTAVARAVHATKVYGSGDTAVRALDDVTVDFARRAVHRHHGPVGLGQVDAHALRRRARLAHRRARCSSTASSSARSSDKELTVLRRERVGFVFQAFNLIPTLDRAGEHHPADRPRRRQGRPGLARRGGQHRRPRRPAHATGPRSSRAASSSASPWPAPSPAGRRSSSPTSPPATSTPAASAEILDFMQRAVRELGQTIVMVTHDPVRGVVRRPRPVPRRRADRRRDARTDGREGARPHEALRGLSD